MLPPVIRSNLVSGTDHPSQHYWINSLEKQIAYNTIVKVTPKWKLSSLTNYYKSPCAFCKIGTVDLSFGWIPICLIRFHIPTSPLHPFATAKTIAIKQPTCYISVLWAQHQQGSKHFPKEVSEKPLESFRIKYCCFHKWVLATQAISS